MRVHQLKDGRWIVVYRPGTIKDDPKRQREYFGKGPDGQAAAIRRNAELGFGESKQMGGPTFREIAQSYVLARYASMAKTTIEDMAWKLDGIIYPAIGEMRAISIRHDVIDQYVIDRKKSGRKTTTIHRELSIIRAVLKWAAGRRLIADNPMDGYQMPKRDDAVIAPPSAAELAAIYAVAAPHLKRVLMLGYYTGMRPGGAELLALRWEHVDLINGTIFVESAKKGGMRARVVPIADGLRELLHTWMEADRKEGQLGLVVHYRNRPIGSIKTAWKQALIRAGITRRIRPYDLRHMAATSMLDAGADLKSVSEILGHASPEMTLKIYQHTNTALRRDAISRLGKVLPVDTTENHK